VVSKESALNAVNLKVPTPIYGSADINTVPTDAEVWIDGKQAGTTPIFLSECLIGKHQVTFKKSNYKERALTFDVTEGQTATIMESLEKTVVEPLHADGTSGNTTTEEAFMVVEQMPEFPGGMAKLMEYLSQNVRYPALAMQQRVQGRVVVEFVVNKDGSISEESILRSVHPLLNEEALRVVKNMPKWSPGMQRGKAVRVRYTVPVLFRLQ
jgi:TonB family protein